MNFRIFCIFVFLIKVMRYFIHLAYNGVRFFGWQKQPNQTSVQEVVTNALCMLLQQNIEIVGAGRTDTGVHALSYYAHFDIAEPINEQDVCYKLNRVLPKDIVVFSIFKVSDNVHARFSAISRTYKYRITNQKNPFAIETEFYFPYQIQIQHMNAASQLLLGTHDFTSFSKLHTDVTNNMCTVTFAKWKELEHGYEFTITANRFLRNMVRSITGTLLDVGMGKLTIEEFEKIIESKNRQNAGKSIAAHGLFLSQIEYANAW